MNPFAFLKKQKEPASKTQTSATSDSEEFDDEDINIGTKVKIVAAMLVVAVATYVALWVQEPTDLKIDVLNGAAETAETIAAEDPVVTDTQLVAAADENSFPVLAEVSITDFTFTPANMTVGKGTTVVWTNMDPVDHTVTADTFSSTALEPGDSYSYKFDEPGEFAYSCSFHPQMTGKIVVTDEQAALPEDETDIDATAEADADASALDEELADLAAMEDFYPSADTDLSADMLTVSDVDLALAESEESAETEAQLVTFSAQELLAEDEEMHNAAVAVSESDKLAKSGPEDILYVGIFIAILYFNRRKILEAL